METQYITGVENDEEFDQDRQAELMEEAKNWVPTTQTGDYRLEEASSKGGFALRDKALTSKMRGVGKEIIFRIGKQILQGKLNLIGIAFPFKCCADYTMLQALSGMCRVNPYHMNAAALCEDPIERVKLLITANMAHIEACNTFEKPLNPILGETYSAYMEDGTQIYCEQTSHKPPISHINVIGPDGIYDMIMHTGYSAKASFNSIKINVIGNKIIEFKDGTRISWNNMEDQINNTFWGTMVRQVVGRQDYKDELNHITAYIETGKVKKKVQDYFQGNICQYGQELYKIYGNYNGYVEFNGERYWDIRDNQVYDVIPARGKLILPSDSRHRKDLVALKENDKDDDICEDMKFELEEAQRYDAKIRKACNDYREQNPGTKFVNIADLKL